MGILEFYICEITNLHVPVNTAPALNLSVDETLFDLPRFKGNSELANLSTSFINCYISSLYSDAGTVYVAIICVVSDRNTLNISNNTNQDQYNDHKFNAFIEFPTCINTCEIPIIIYRHEIETSPMDQL